MPAVCLQYFLIPGLLTKMSVRLFFRSMQGHKQKWLVKPHIQRAKQQKRVEQVFKGLPNPFGTARVQRASQSLRRFLSLSHSDPVNAAVNAWEGTLLLRMVHAWTNIWQKTYYQGHNLENTMQDIWSVRSVLIYVALCCITGHVLRDKVTVCVLKKS